jgi:DNA-binding GntR family transcriptional regulator
MKAALSQMAYRKIRQAFVDQSISLDDKISEAALAKKLGISRTPVREAIQRLQNEGLLYQVPKSGTFVVQPDRNQLIDAYGVREALECQAAKAAARKMSPRERAELGVHCKSMHEAIVAMRDAKLDELADLPLQQYLAADLAFHTLLLTSAGNEMATKIVMDNRMRARIFGRRSHRRTLHHVSWVWAVHTRIARAVQKRDARQAQKWMRRHIRNSLRDALAEFDAQASAQNRRRMRSFDAAKSVDELTTAFLL